MDSQFIHLHVHSEYSVVDGLAGIKTLLQTVKSHGGSAVAITDQSNFYALVKFYKAALAEKVKPIMGTEIYIRREEEAATKLVLLCQNKVGYKNITEILSRAYLEGQHQGIPIIQLSWLDGATDGLIALSAGLNGDIGQALLNDKRNLAETYLDQYQTLFPQRFYLEISRTGKPREADYIQFVVELAEKKQVPVVATNDVRFIKTEDFEAHEARVCINRGEVLEDTNRSHDYTEEQFLRSPQEMLELFSDIPEAIQNTGEIAKRCNLKLNLGEVFLPNFPVPDGMTIDTFFEQEAKKGLEQRLKKILTNQSVTREPYDQRLVRELEVIKDMGFAGYFLIVADFIQWARDNDIPVGPGRGSGAGSLIAYSLGITDLDPLEFDLLFERFLNPERVSMPDFDIDFCMEGRDRVIDYVAKKYGRESVSQIITFGTMAAKAVVRDVGRVLSHPYGFVDKLAKLIPFELGITLEKALQREEELLNRYYDEEEVKTLIDLAMKLEGVPRNVGKHAGGVVIAPSKLTDFTPLYCEENGENVVTQLDKDDVEAIGLVKFDFLGLRTLTIIDWALKTIKDDSIDINTIPLDDPKVFELLKDCNTTAVFQLESRGMKDLIKRLQPDKFDEIVALVALFRPGPLQSGMVDDFIDRKHGRAKVEHFHPSVEPIMQATYGVILYQEQVMQIAQDLAGYSLGGADLLRRAMGKKKPEEMAKQRAIFVDGATHKEIDPHLANEIFDLMEKFAGYGFNKSHSAAYAMLSYQTAWLKAHYPAQFMAAVLSSDMDNTDKVVIFIDDCKKNNLTVIPPDINRSHYKFTVNDSGEIIFGLGAIKGMGEAAIESVIAARNEGKPFSSLFDFAKRIDTRKVNRRVLDALIKSGAMDSFEVERGSMFATIDRALAAAEQHQRNAQVGQSDLFAISDAEQDDDAVKLDYISIPPWNKNTILEGEKETLGFYLSGHPIDEHRKELNHFTTSNIVELEPTDKQTVVIGAYVASVRVMLTKKGNQMAFVSLEDGTGRIELAVFSDTFEESREHLVKGKLLVVEGEVSVDDYTGGYRMSAKRLLSLDQARSEYAKCLFIHLSQTQLQSGMIDQLKTSLTPFRGGKCSVCVTYLSDNAKARLMLGREWQLNIAGELLETLKQLCGAEAVEIAY